MKSSDSKKESKMKKLFYTQNVFYIIFLIGQTIEISAPPEAEIKTYNFSTENNPTIKPTILPAEIANSSMNASKRNDQSTASPTNTSTKTWIPDSFSKMLSNLSSSKNKSNASIDLSENSKPTASPQLDLSKNPKSAELPQSENKSFTNSIIPKISSPFATRNEMTPKITVMIDNWINEYADSTSNQYVRANLEDEINNMIFTTNQTTKARELIDPTTSLPKVKDALTSLMEKYKTNENVTAVLQNNIKAVDAYKAAKTTSSKQTNTVVTPFYTPETKIALLKMMNIKPEFDPITHAITNMPSIEMIKQEAEENPTQETFNAINAAIKAIAVAQHTISSDPSLISNINSYNPLLKSTITDQLKSFDAQLKTVLTNPNFDKYKSIELKTILETTGLSDLTLSSAVNYLRSGMKTANQAANQIEQFKNDPVYNASGYAAVAFGGYAEFGIPGAIIDTILYHVAKENIPAMMNKLNTMTIAELLDFISPSEKTLILNAHTTMEDLNSNKVSLQGELNKVIKGSNAQQIAQAKLQANNIIENSYYQPALQEAVFTLIGEKPQFDEATGTIKNMPSVETILTKATKVPSQNGYKALKAVLKATTTAIYSAEYDSSILSDILYIKQLYIYKDQLTQAINSPEIIKYQNTINRVANYTQSLVPTTTDVINSTGLMNTTIDTALNNPTATKAVNFTLNQTGLGNQTIGQMIS